MSRARSDVAEDSGMAHVSATGRLADAAVLSQMVRQVKRHAGASANGWPWDIAVPAANSTVSGAGAVASGAFSTGTLTVVCGVVVGVAKLREHDVWCTRRVSLLLLYVYRPIAR